MRLERPRNPTILLSLAAGTTAAVLGALTIERRSLWMDEALDVAWSELAWSDFLRVAFQNEGSQALYLLLLKPWLALTSTDEWVARAPSVLFAAAAAALLVFLGARLFDSRWVAFGAGLLLATNAFSVAWSQQARQYTLAMLFAVVVTYLFVLCLEKDAWRWWLTYGVLAGVSVYAHFFVALVLASHVVALAFVRRPAIIKRWAAAAGIAFVVALPALNFTLNHDTGQVSWIPELSTAYLRDVLYETSGESRLAIAVGAVALLTLAFAAGRAVRDSWRYVLVGSWLVVPLVLAMGISYFKPMIVDRYLIVSVPALALATAFAAYRLGNRLGTAVLAVLLFVSLTHVRDWYGSLIEQDWRGAVSHVERQKQPDEQLLAYPSFLAAPVDYYTQEPVDTSDTLTSDRAWIVTVTDRAAEIEAMLAEAGYRAAERSNFVSVEVWRVEKPPADEDR